MRFTVTAISLSSAVFLSACGSGGGGGAAPSDDEPTMAFDGTWLGDCLPDGSGYAVRTLRVAGSGGSEIVSAFDDAACAVASFDYESPFTLDYGDRVALSDGTVAQSVDIVFDAPLTITPRSDAAATNLSANGFCGNDVYALDTAIDVSSCADAGLFAERVGSTLPQIAAVETGTAGDVLLLGDTGSDILDATEVRPSALDRRTLYSRVGN